MYISGMRRSKFSGVYSFSTDWTESRRKTHYFVWELPDGAFAVQELNSAFQPLADPERISARSFKKNFKAEPESLAMPVTTPDLTQLENKGASGGAQAGAISGQKAENTQAGAQQGQGGNAAQAPSPAQSITQNAAQNAVQDVAQNVTQDVAQAAASGQGAMPAPNAAQGIPPRPVRPAGQQAAPSGQTVAPSGQIAPPAGQAASQDRQAAASSGPVTGHEAGPAAGRESVPPDLSASSGSLQSSAAGSKPFAATPTATASPTAAAQRPAVSPQAPHAETAEKQNLLLQKQKNTDASEAELGAPARFAAEKTRPQLKGVNLSVAESGSLAPQPLLSVDQAAVNRVYDPEIARQAKMTESKLREAFRQALLRLKRPRERLGALKTLEQLAETTENICTAHKHMFRDFGVRLRQNSHPDLALLFSRKVVQLAPNDDHAHFNLARVLCVLGQYDEAAAHIRAAMNMDSDEHLYFRMLVYIRKEKLQNRGRKASSGR